VRERRLVRMCAKVILEDWEEVCEGMEGVLVNGTEKFEVIKGL